MAGENKGNLDGFLKDKQDGATTEQTGHAGWHAAFAKHLKDKAHTAIDDLHQHIAPVEDNQTAMQEAQSDPEEMKELKGFKTASKHKKGK